jgi:hypothetical protein
MFFFGWIIIYGLYEAVFGAENRAGAIGAVIITLPFFMAGYKLRKSGTDKKKIKEYALKKQSECGFVNASDVAENTKTKMVTVTKVLKNMERKELINIRTATNSENRENNGNNKSNEIVASNNKQHENKIKQLKCLLEEDLITEEEYKNKCIEIRNFTKQKASNKVINKNATNIYTKNENTIIIDGKMKADELIQQFSEKINMGIRLYNGRKFANGESMLAEIGFTRKQPSELTIRKNRKVGKFEEYFKQITGLTIQVEDRNGQLADNNLSLGQVS